MASRFRVYLKPFDDEGIYAEDWMDVTDDVIFDGLGSIAVDLDNTEYDIGVYRNSNIKLTFKNANGKYSDVGDSQSLFRFKRSDTLCRLSWQHQEEAPYAGLAEAGSAVITEEVD